MENTVIKLNFGFEVNTIKVWNKYRQEFFIKYLYSFNGLFLGSTLNFYNSDSKLNQWLEDIQNKTISLNSCCSLSIALYK